MKEITKQEKLEKNKQEIAKIQDDIKEIGLSAHDQWADGGDGWHDERYRLMRTRYQVLEAHLRRLKQENLAIKKGRTKLLSS